MKLLKLKLKKYRNYDKLDIELSPNLNIFIGNNAQGKSNILESVFVLALTKSYMNIKDYYLWLIAILYSFFSFFLFKPYGILSMT